MLHRYRWSPLQQNFLVSIIPTDGGHQDPCDAKMRWDLILFGVSEANWALKDL